MDKGKWKKLMLFCNKIDKILSNVKTCKLPLGIQLRKTCRIFIKGGKQMNALACAPNDNTIQWSQIDLDKCYKIVRKLQERIVKAQKKQQFGKVKSLQWLLTHSFSAKVIAVRKVIGNKGKKYTWC